MNFIRFSWLFPAMVIAAAGLYAQQQDPQPSPDLETLEESPVFEVTTVAGTTEAVNYRFRRSDTKIGFKGTSLLPTARGEAEVKSRRGGTEISAQFEGFEPATNYGAEYLTYVLWAVSPEGRALNLGEVYVDNGRARLDTTTELETFGMVVTAEPYFAVRRPSDVIVAENEVLPETRGETEPIQAKYELLERGEYEKLANPLALTVDTRRVPLDVYQARNALQIAKSFGADTFASETYQKAVEGMELAETRLRNKESKKDISDAARRAVQIAEDARELTVERVTEARREAERRAAAEREEQARLSAEQAAQEAADAQERQRREAELREQAEKAATEAERKTLEAELAASQAREQMQQALREKEEANRLIEQARAEAEQAKLERQKLEEATLEANRAAEEALAEKREAEQMIAMAREEAAQARIEADRLAELKAQAESAAEQAMRERDEMRDRMQGALSKIVETRESARGLILNLPDILFDFGKSTLRPEARETLSRISGVMMVTPGYNILIEGHTDAVGSDESNQRLSEARSQAVYDYFAENGEISREIMRTEGFGESRPVDTNDTDQGRQKNRRVEIIIQDQASPEAAAVDSAGAVQ